MKSSFFSKIAVFALVPGLLGSDVIFAAANYFSDVPIVNKHYAAIQYLAATGIIQGYPDGTFQPDRPVSRVEFLKLVLESSGVAADAGTATNFSDVDENAWYAKYIRKARAKGWIEGYPDSTFKPEQSINKVEGLKIIAEVQGWVTPATIEDPPFEDTPRLAWYTPYVAYAKERNFLEETGRFFIPEAVLSRGKVSEMLFRIDVTALNDAEKYSSRFADTIPPEPEEPAVITTTSPSPLQPPETELDFTPYAYAGYPDGFFSNVKLKTGFPNTFYLNEVYYFEGTINSGSYDKAFIFLAPPDESDTSKFTNYVAQVSNNAFRIPVIFREPGNYRLGLILGNSGESKVATVSVLPTLPSAPLGTGNDNAPLMPKVEYKNGKTTFSWFPNDNRLIRLLVFRGGKTGIFIFRQPVTSFDVDYADFEGFNEGTVYYQFQVAGLKYDQPLELGTEWETGETAKFQAITHQFSEIHEDMVSLTSFDETLENIEPIHFSGTAKTNIYKEAAVIKPDGTVVIFNLESSNPFSKYFDADVIAAGNDYTFHYEPSTAGTYIIEINSQDGEAVLNAPVYVKTGIPLLPDFFDLHGSDRNEEFFDIPALRAKLLDLINGERIKAGFSAVAADSALNNLAQLHSEDMVNRNFFGHVNPDGETPDDRRIELQIPTPVGENLAQSPTIPYTHYGFMRSAIHRKNILDPKWTRIGLGIAKNDNGQILTAEEFSGNPLTEDDLVALEGKVISGINGKRRSLEIPVVESDSTLTSLADQWSDKMVNGTFFDFVSPGGETLSKLVQDAVPDKAVQALILESNNSDKLIEEILAGNDAVESQWRKLGVGIKVNNTGKLKATLLYTTY